MMDVVDGRLDFAVSDGTGFRSLRFRTSPRVDAMLLKRRGKPVNPGRGKLPAHMMTRTELCVLTGFSPSTIAALISRGVIETTGPAGIIARSSGLAFHRRYLNPSRFVVDKPGAALKKLGMKSVFTDIEHNVIVERDDFESASGISTLPTSASARSMWKAFFEIGREVAPSVIIPEEMSGHHVALVATSRKLRFMVDVGDEGFRIVKFYDAVRTSYEWKTSKRYESQIRDAFSSFQTTETRGRVEFACFCRTDGDFRTALAAIGKVIEFHRYRQPVIHRLKKD